MTQAQNIRELVYRLARLDSASGWTGDLNPSQRAALCYLSRANRFSRSPSHVADYLGTTRGTTTQSLKSLLQKGYVTEHRSQADRRAVRYELTATGRAIAGSETPLERAVSGLNDHDRAGLEVQLLKMLRNLLANNGGREFGVCNSCIHFSQERGRKRCKLLEVTLSDEDSQQLCHEQEPA